MVVLTVLLLASCVVVRTTSTLHLNSEMMQHPASQEQTFLSCARYCRKVDLCKAFNFTTSILTCGVIVDNKCGNVSENETKLKTPLIWQKLNASETQNKRIYAYKRSERQCKPSRLCPVPEWYPQSTVKFDSRAVSSLATYTCNSGLAFCGQTSRSVRCQEDGSWEDLASDCSNDTWIRPTLPFFRSIDCPLKDGSVVEFRFQAQNQTSGFELQLMLRIRITFYNGYVQCHGGSGQTNVFDSRGVGVGVGKGDVKYEISWNTDVDVVTRIVVEPGVYRIVINDDTACYVKQLPGYGLKESIFVQSGPAIMYIQVRYPPDP